MQQKRPHLQHLLFAHEAEQQTFVNLRFMFVGGDEGDKANFTVSASSHWVTLESFGMSAFSSVSMITGRGCFSESVNIQRVIAHVTLHWVSLNVGDSAWRVLHRRPWYRSLDSVAHSLMLINEQQDRSDSSGCTVTFHHFKVKDQGVSKCLPPKMTISKGNSFWARLLL